MFNYLMLGVCGNQTSGEALARLRTWFVGVSLTVLTAIALAGCSQSSSASGPVSSGAVSESASSASHASGSVLDANEVPSAQAVLAESEWGDLFATIGDTAVTFGRRVQGELPTVVYVQWSGVGGGEPIEFTDPGEIRAAFNALAGASIGDEAKETHTDDYTSFQFTFADGEQFSVSFDSLSVTLHENGRYATYSVVVDDDFRAFAGMARQKTLATY
ncbi:MAG: hypothetical protein IJ087_22270 [Eggerthellaceae bacterium]|nr:hypothetical protein [Eggerthellaceae bacterium]